MIIKFSLFNVISTDNIYQQNHLASILSLLLSPKVEEGNPLTQGSRALQCIPKKVFKTPRPLP